MTVPQKAADAATRGVLAAFGADRTAASESIIRYALEAAAPHIAAAERERIRQLALTEQAKYPLGTIASHALETFAAQLTEGTTT